MTDPTELECEHCGAIFRSHDGIAAGDMLADHYTDVHQDQLPNFDMEVARA